MQSFMNRNPAPVDGPAPLTLHVLGELSLRRGADVVLHAGKPAAVLVVLASAPARSCTRGQLVDLLWSDLDAERGRANLRQALLVLRRTLGGDSFVVEGERLSLARPLPSDRDAFLRAIDAGELEQAVAQYGGDFVPNFATPGGAAFEHWCDAERSHLRLLFLRAGEDLVRDRMARADASGALSLARRLQREDPDNEAVIRLRLEAELAAGGSTVALLEADRVEAQFAEDQRPFEPSTRALLTRIRKGSAPHHGIRHDPLRVEMVGRDSVFAQLMADWQRSRGGEFRAVQLLAPAGLGKSRVLEELHTRIVASGGRSIRVVALRTERDVPFALAATIVAALATLRGAGGVSAASAASLVALSPDVASTFSVAPDVSIGDEAHRRRLVAVQDLLGALLDEAPLAILVDDAHWADATSLRLFIQAVERSRGKPLLVVVTSRHSFGAPEGWALAMLENLTVAHVEALLQSIAAAPDEAWWSAFVARMTTATGGSPLRILMALGFLLERLLLHSVAGVWASARPSALLEQAAEGTMAGVRVVKLPEAARRLLELLALADAELAEAALAGASGLPAAEVTGALVALEERGLAIRRGDAVWAVAHQEIADEVLALLTDVERTTRRTALGRTLVEHASSLAQMRRAVRMIADEASDDEIVTVFTAWARSDRAGRVTWPEMDEMLRGALPRARADVLTRRLRRIMTAPTTRRRARRWIARAAVLAGVILALRWLTSPAVLVVVQAPIFTNVATGYMERRVVIGVEDRLGRRLHTDGVPVVFDITFGDKRFRSGAERTRAGVVAFDTVPKQVAANYNYGLVLHFSAEGLRDVRWQYVRERPGLWLVGGSINGTPVSGVMPRITVRPGAEIDGRLLLRYRTVLSGATIFMGESATWMDRRSDTTSFRSLVTPLDDGKLEMPIHRIAPRTPGRYAIIAAFGAETRAAFVFSQTNWTCHEPAWNDGNDLQDVSLEALRSAARDGVIQRTFRRCMLGTKVVPAFTGTWGEDVAMTAVEIEVVAR